MSITTDLNTLRDHLCDVRIPDDMAGDDALEAMRCVLAMRGVVDHLAGDGSARQTHRRTQDWFAAGLRSETAGSCDACRAAS